MSALSDLLATQPMSARDAARKAEGMGIHLPAGTIAAYWSGRHGRPSPDTLTRLAQVIDISLRRLQQAAWGAEAPLGEYRPPTEANLLDDRQRRALDELIRSIVKTQGAPHGMETAAQPDASSTPDPNQKTPPAGRAETEQYVHRLGVADVVATYGIPASNDIPFQALWDAGYRPAHTSRIKTALAAAAAKSGTQSGTLRGAKFWKAFAAELGGTYGNRGFRFPSPPDETASDHQHQYGLAARRAPKSQGHTEYDDHATAGEESQDGDV